jgi:Haem-NO-binding
MKGVLFTVIEEVVISNFGEDAWDEVLRKSGADGAYTSLGDYPDSDLFQIVNAMSEVLGRPVPEVLVIGGTLAFPTLAERHSYIMTGLNTWKDVLVHLVDIIHPEVHKIYAGANAPDFGVELTETGLLLEYRSKRRLCHLAEGLVRGSGDWFKTPVEVEHISCIERGDSTCVLSVTE